jgi:multimeric flavodoxin WrbA
MVGAIMNVVLINAAPGSDVNSTYIADKLQSKYEDCKRFDLCDLVFDASYPIKKCKEGFQPDAVEEGLRDAMSAVYDADLIIFLSPNYFSFVTGTAKLFMDKFFVFLNQSGVPMFEREKKFFFILAQASLNRSHGQTAQDWVKGFCAVFRMKYFGITVPNCKGKEPEGARMKMDEISMSLNMFV